MCKSHSYSLPVDVIAVFIQIPDRLVEMSVSNKRSEMRYRKSGEASRSVSSRRQNTEAPFEMVLLYERVL